MMNKRTIRTFVTVSLALNILSFALSYAFTSPTGPGALVIGFFGLAGGVLTLITLVLALIRQARLKQWGWFIGTLLFSFLCLIIYLIVTPEVPQYPVPSTRYYPMQTYQPMQPYQPPQFYPPDYAPEPIQQYEEPIQQYEPQSYQEATDPEFYRERRQAEPNQE